MIDFLTSGVVTIAAFIAVISLVVVIHELGHYYAGRIFGIHAEAFSLGFGPTLFAVKDRRGTIWRIAAFPLGGYVKFMGDAGAASEPDQAKLAEMRAKLGPDAEKCYHFKPVWQRAIVVIAGPLANFILAIVIFAGIAAGFGERGLSPIVGEVRDNSPAQAAGFEPGDRILAVGGSEITRFTDIRMELMWRPGDTVTFDVERDGQAIQLRAAPELQRLPDGFGGYRDVAVVGFTSSNEIFERRFGPIESLGIGVARTFGIVETTAQYVWRIITGRAPPNLLNGPVGIVTVSGQVANGTIDAAPSAGAALGGLALNLIQLAGFFSIGLGLVNLLPIPILDGGHLVYYAYEAVAGRPLSEKAQAIGFRVGLALVLGLMLVATWNDLVYLGGLGS
ncbi:M50 family metallopeptidase [Hyphobacterium sp.]|uniref:M50 family metallopeptidase n=1 Tax=Hyphobacterium sp. TaxID=2004662 RepID=UPI003BABD453